MATAFPQIPYGWADFEAMRLERCLYVDKTRFLHQLERERFAFLIRPRRFGKSCWVSLLESYYDRNRSDRFETLFAGTDIGRQPTANRHRYVILRFDFSAFDDTLETLRERFETYCLIVLRYALEANADLFPEAMIDRILSYPSIDGKLNELFKFAAKQGIALYVLIDEYDNFANSILAHRGTEAYHSFTHGGGFYRSFFATLKAGAGQGGGVERMFITGVSPITMDDVTSGFNIGKNVSLHPEFNELLGFTEHEVRTVLEIYRECGVFKQDVDAALDMMRQWYDGYRFAEDVETDLYNTDMVLYFLDHSIPNRGGPKDPIDTNVRIDYGKLRHLLVTGRRLNGNFDLLASFPLERLAGRENFLSLLHYFGLLSIRGVTRGLPRLGIPNQTVKRLMYGYLRDAWDEMDVFSADFYDLLRLTGDMAYEGAWRPAVEYLSGAVARQTAIRDYIDGERVVHAFFAAYLGLTDHYVLHSERELNKGYADLHLEPFMPRHHGIGYGYLIEFKYLKRGDKLDGARAAGAGRQALDQLRGYLADERLRRHPGVRHIGLALVFHGWELVWSEAVALP